MNDLVKFKYLVNYVIFDYNFDLFIEVVFGI